jgi:hypothetical protein
MQPDPGKRFQSAAELRASLGRVRANSRTARKIRRVATGLVVTAVLAGGGLVIHDRVSPNHPGRAESGTAVPAAILTPLSSLDLSRDVVRGAWHWLESKPGGTLALDHIEDDSSKRVRLSVQPGAGAYDFSFRLVLNHERGDCGVILRVGAARTGLALDALGASGLGLVRGLRWDKNDSTVRQDLPLDRSLFIEIAVRPAGENVSVVVRVDGAPLLHWEGPQSDLSLFELPPFGWSLTDEESLGFASFNGAILIRDVKVKLLP